MLHTLLQCWKERHALRRMAESSRKALGERRQEDRRHGGRKKAPQRLFIFVLFLEGWCMGGGGQPAQGGCKTEQMWADLMVIASSS